MTDTERKLMESFKELVIAKPFDKITIKDITDHAGVVRPTFYHYFQDKYHVFEVILEKDLTEHISALQDLLLFKEAFSLLLKYFDSERDFYKAAFVVEGPNSPYEILKEKISDDILALFEDKKLTFVKEIQPFHVRYLAEYYALNLAYAIKSWMTEDYLEDLQPEEIQEAYQFLTTHSLPEIIQVNRDQN